LDEDPEDGLPPMGWADVVRLSDVRERALEWLWPGWVPLGKLTVLDGDVGVGKSSTLLDLAARVSRDGLMPDGSAGAAGAVLILSAEEGEADGLKPRLLAAGARLERVHSLRQVLYDDRPRPVQLPEDWPLLYQAAAALNARLLVVDPLLSFLGARGESAVRRALAALARLAEGQGCAVVGLRHLSRGQSARAIDRGAGGVGILGAARAGLLLAADPDRPRGRVLAVTKCNLAERPRARRLELEPTPTGVCRVAWGEATDFDPDQPARSASAEEEREEARTKVRMAMEFLRHTLQTGCQRVKYCLAKAAELGISRRTIGRAARQLGLVVTYADPLGLGEHTWRLPDDVESVGHLAT
jgi:hypothetical protein